MPDTATVPIPKKRAQSEPSPSPTERPRLQIDFTPEGFQHLNIMKDRAKVRSAAEVAKNALKFYDWYLEKQAEGYQLLIAKGDSVKHVELLL